MKIIGHRGAKGLAPENTIASLKKALEIGVDEIETDLRVTKDNVVVLMHDHSLTNPAGTTAKIKDCTYAQLRALKPDIATLEEALKVVNQAVPLLLEVKPKESLKPIVTVLSEYLAEGWKTENLLLGSFSQKTLRELHRELPQIQKVVIESWSGVRAQIRARQVNTHRLNMNQRWLWPGFILAVSRRGYELYPYTLNDKTKAEKWEKYGLAGVITDFPDRYK